MTRKERRNPGIIDGSRRRRIAAGSGTQVQDVNRLLKQFMEMQRVMKSMKGGRLQRMLSAFKGQMPPGFPGADAEPQSEKIGVSAAARRVESALFFGPTCRCICASG